MQDSRSVVVAVAVLELLAIALWMGGLVALGAIAAPAVFGIVPTPTSADAMTLAFRRFDRVAIVCGALTLVCEATASARRGRVRPLDLGRALGAVLATSLAVVQGAWISPTIAALHEAGAIRGLGEPGMALERTHRLAEASGKLQVLLLSVIVALVVERVSRPRVEARALQPALLDPRSREGG